MTDRAAQTRALRPLWLLTTGSILAAVSTEFVPFAVSPAAPLVLGIGGILTFGLALHRRSRAPAALWFLAGLALVGWRGLEHAADRLFVDERLLGTEAAVRIQAIVLENWTEQRWGQRTAVQVLSANFRDRPISLSRRCNLEIRGAGGSSDLPPPGAKIEMLARIRGSSSRPLLVSSPRLVTSRPGRSALPLLRDRLAHHLIEAAGTDVHRLRAAETASALALGRRDLVPRERRDRWRRSGLAHVLAVSGLHVGLVGGAVWIVVAWLGASPRSARLILIAVLPSYALLAGAAPSALRAALMGVIYLSARLMGRAILPMAAILLTASCLLFVRPGLVSDPGFQLTIIITAALVRWVPELMAALPIPRWLSAAISVPVIAQTASTPLVAWHFRSLIPGSVVANIVVLPLIAPIVLLSVMATVLAPIWSAAAAACLQMVSWLSRTISFASTPARFFELVTPQMPLAAAAGLAVFGWFALQTGRRGVIGSSLWIGTLLLFGVHLFSSPGAVATVAAMPVGDGGAVLLRHDRSAVLFDAGRYQRQAAELLADARTRRLESVIVSHTDEDHIGGMARVLETMSVGKLLIPLWMMSEIESVLLLRPARRRGVRVVPLSRGVRETVGSIRIEALWPPPVNPPATENERSLVARAMIGDQVTLLTADIGRETEFRLARLSSLDCDVLIVAHHGSRGSSSGLWLDRTTPEIAIIPAAPNNTYGHPHEAVLERLAARRIPVRWPARDGPCGATWDGIHWIPYP